jgi:hypothetical protein
VAGWGPRFVTGTSSVIKPDKMPGPKFFVSYSAIGDRRSLATRCRLGIAHPGSCRWTRRRPLPLDTIDDNEFHGTGTRHFDAPFGHPTRAGRTLRTAPRQPRWSGIISAAEVPKRDGPVEVAGHVPSLGGRDKELSGIYVSNRWLRDAANLGGPKIWQARASGATLAWWNSTTCRMRTMRRFAACSVTFRRPL